jgi:hypothetical protein
LRAWNKSSPLAALETRANRGVNDAVYEWNKGSPLFQPASPLDYRIGHQER